jgi:homoserine acetyltransferase
MQQLTAAAVISIGARRQAAYLIEGAEVQIAAVKTDPKRNNGDYYGKEEPLDGLTMAFRIIPHQGGNYANFDKTVGRNGHKRPRTQPGVGTIGLGPSSAPFGRSMGWQT